jgi:acetyl esterase/lipase
MSAGRMTRSTHSYGSHPSQLAELFLPAGAGPHPVTVVVHGGYWRAQYDRSLMEGICIDLAAHGLAAWNLEYRRVGIGGGWPGTFDDVAAGIDALDGIDAPLDLSLVSAVGHSAGGHLGFWAAARPMLPADAPGAAPRVLIQAAVSQAGVLDLALAAGLMPSSSPTRALLGDPTRHYERYVLASPRERLPLGISQLVLHGDRDDTVSMRIATSYAAAAHEVGDPCELVVLSHTGHFEHIDPGAEAWHVARDWLLSQASASRS